MSASGRPSADWQLDHFSALGLHHMRGASLKHSVFSALLRATLVGSMILCAALAWLPASVVIRTSAGGKIEHGVAYFGLAVISGLAFRERPSLVGRMLVLMAFAGILEVGQFFASGRHPSIFDFAAGSAGIAVGGLLVWLMRRQILAFMGVGPLRPAMGD